MDTIKAIIGSFAGATFYITWQFLVMFHTASLF
jgi:hypothetical protein